MVNGFEDQTAPLNELEADYMKIIIPLLQNKVGVNNAVTNKTIVAGMKRVYEIKIAPARLRKIINHIRRHGLVSNLIASSKGYYIENNLIKRDAYIDSLMQRANAIKAVALSLRSQTQGTLFSQ